MKPDSNAEQSLGVEQAIHGATWGRMHGGYFSDPQVARPLVEAVQSVAEKTIPPPSWISVAEPDSFSPKCGRRAWRRISRW